jgi:hypothetical protein
MTPLLPMIKQLPRKPPTTPEISKRGSSIDPNLEHRSRAGAAKWMYRRDINVTSSKHTPWVGGSCAE